MSNEKRDVQPDPAQVAEGFPAAPPTQRDSVQLPTPCIQVPEPTATQVFMAWEKLRLAYNGILIAVVACVAVPRGLILSPFFIADMVVEVVVANLCFCAGFFAEGYLCWLRMPRLTARVLVFCIGMIVAIVLAVPATTRVIDRLPQWVNWP